MTDATARVRWRKAIPAVPAAATLGPQWGKRPPVAVANPIFVDVDGGRFAANGDNLARNVSDFD